jgi:hypothetical protein
MVCKLLCPLVLKVVFNEKKQIGGTRMKTKFLFMIIGLMMFALAGCSSTATNSTTNANMRNMNVANNTAVVVNSETNRPNTTNTNRWSNTNVNRADYDRDRAEYERDKGSSTIGQGANDSWIWFKARAALLSTSDLRESTINVDVVNDVITLKGTVASAAEKTKAEQVAKGIEGQKGVKNELKVAPNDSMTNTGGNSTSDNRNSNANANRR